MSNTQLHKHSYGGIKIMSSKEHWFCYFPLHLFVSFPAHGATLLHTFIPLLRPDYLCFKCEEGETLFCCTDIGPGNSLPQVLLLFCPKRIFHWSWTQLPENYSHLKCRWKRMKQRGYLRVSIFAFLPFLRLHFEMTRKGWVCFLSAAHLTWTRMWVHI